MTLNPNAIRLANPPTSGGGLATTGISFRFGGVKALTDVSLSVGMASVTGLVGPNGAGKTTFINVCSGVLRPTAGEVYLNGALVTGESIAGRARRGLTRTFQRTDLAESLTVEKNVGFGREGVLASRRKLGWLMTHRGERAEIEEATARSMELCGLTPIRHRMLNELSMADRRRVELARAVCANPTVVLLDEPCAGLDTNERQRFVDVVAGLAQETRMGVLLIDHDAALVAQCAEKIFVLNLGEVIFEGASAQLWNDVAVRGAFFGTLD